MSCNGGGGENKEDYMHTGGTDIHVYSDEFADLSLI